MTARTDVRGRAAGPRSGRRRASAARVMPADDRPVDPVGDGGAEPGAVGEVAVEDGLRGPGHGGDLVHPDARRRARGPRARWPRRARAGG